MKDKKILFMDTSDHVCSVALAYDDTMIEKSVGNKLNHSKTLMPLIEEVFENVKFSVKDLDYIFATVGPGSFTGIRIGVATAKGLSHFHNIPLVKVNTLTNICAYKNEENSIIVPLIDARRNTFYAQFYESDYKNAITEIMHLDILEIIEMLKMYNKKVYLVGDNLLELLKDIELNDNFTIIDIKDDIKRASKMSDISDFILENKDNIVDYKTLEPFYLKKSQAEREYDEKQGIK